MTDRTFVAIALGLMCLAYASSRSCPMPAVAEILPLPNVEIIKVRVEKPYPDRLPPSQDRIHACVQDCYDFYSFNLRREPS